MRSDEGLCNGEEGTRGGVVLYVLSVQGSRQREIDVYPTVNT